MANPEKQQQAYNLYFNTDRTSTEIADILDVNRKTIYLWVKNGKWEEMKRAANVAPGMILLDVYGHISAINNKIRQREPEDRIPTMEEVEKLRKLLGMVKNINKNHIGSYMESFTELVRFIGGTDEVLSWKVAEYAKRYVRGNFGDMEMDTSVKSKKQVAFVKDNLAAIEETEPLPEIVQEPVSEIEQNEEDELQLEPETEPGSGNENWEYGTMWGNDGAILGHSEAVEFYNQQQPEPATVAELEPSEETLASENAPEKLVEEFGAFTELDEEETRHKNIMKQAEALATKFGHTLPETKPKPKNEFGLTINGYWTEDNVDGLPTYRAYMLCTNAKPIKNPTIPSLLNSLR